MESSPHDLILNLLRKNLHWSNHHVQIIMTEPLLCPSLIRCDQRSETAPFTINPAHCTVRLSPYTLHPTPYTQYPTPYTLNPTPYTLRACLSAELTGLYHKTRVVKLENGRQAPLSLILRWKCPLFLKTFSDTHWQCIASWFCG